MKKIAILGPAIDEALYLREGWERLVTARATGQDHFYRKKGDNTEWIVWNKLEKVWQHEVDIAPAAVVTVAGQPVKWRTAPQA